MSASSVSALSAISVTVLKGSAESFGSELPETSPLPSSNSCAIFTYFGATLLLHPSDVEITQEMKDEAIAQEEDDDDPSVLKGLDDAYVAEKQGDSIITAVNIVNTHAQLEVMRDSARRSLMGTGPAGSGIVAPQLVSSPPPRVLIVGDADSGKVRVRVRVRVLFHVDMGVLL